MIYIRPKEGVTVWGGFGGAITEATAYNYSLLSPTKRRAFLKAYYEDMGYTWGRVSIGSNDFCLAPFEYTAEASLEDFSVEHDKRYVLPMLSDIYKIRELNLVAAPWSPPSFMKSNRKLTGGGKLKKKYYETYANYLCLFLEAYRRYGFNIDFLSVQNEPEAAQRWESCTWSLSEQRDFIDNYLFPKLEGGETEIIVWDHNKEKLCKVASKLLSEKVAGIGFHNYSGIHEEQVRLTRQAFPRALMVQTEGCAAYEGSWQGAAEYYLRDVIADMNGGANVYIDWNMLLDQEGGPSWADNPVKAPVVLNEGRDDFVRTPIFEYLRVVARAFPPGTRIVRSVVEEDELLAVAGVYEGDLRIVLMNTAGHSQRFDIDVEGFMITGIMPPHTILQR
ncbi:hypothetical protein IJ096_03340 [Candidatus Saccharibacteria bacterium]|nr:hypothetical protein [Candidatus Saccharibacteria bacterium]